MLSATSRLVIMILFLFQQVFVSQILRIFLVDFHNFSFRIQYFLPESQCNFGVINFLEINGAASPVFT